MTTELAPLTLTLTEAEQRELAKLLGDRLGGLAHEIHHTDSRAYREGLVQEEAVLRSLLGKVGQSPPASGG